MEPRITRRRALAVGGTLALLASGCGVERSDPAARDPGSRLPPPAETANSPEQTRTPSGDVVAIGPIAEGVVADPRTGLVAVGLRDPFRLALVDGASGEVRREVPLSGHLRHLQLEAPGGPVLVPAESANALLRVALPAGEVISRVGVDRFPHDATATAGGSIVVANEFGGTVSVVEGGRVVHAFGNATQPGGVDAVGERVGMVDVRENSLTVYDIPGRRRIAELPAGEGTTHVVTGPRGRLLVADTEGDAITIFGLDPEPRMLDRLPLPGSPYGISYDDARDWLWVTLTATNEVVGIDFAGGAPRVAVRLPTIRQPNTVAVNSATGRVFVASPTEGALQLIDA
ncbi:MAG: YncE family protein [Pseudonocardiaceae bacterium]|nr:YncE family protein [Pseudonocardiaceae bacterium]